MGLFEETIKTFRVYNQPLFAFPDTSDMSGAILCSILRNEDMATHMQRAMFSNMNMGHLRRFNKRLDDEELYSPGYPDVGISLGLETNSDIQDAVDDVYGRSMDIWYARAGTFTPFDWITHELSNSTSQTDFTYILTSSVTEITPHYVLMASAHGGNIGEIQNALFGFDGTANVVIEYTDALDEVVTETFSTNIGPISTTESHYIVGVGYTDYVAGSVSDSLFDIWAYDVSDGTYPDLALPDFHFGSTVGQTECFPPVPVRVKNVNFTDPTSGLDEDEIIKLLDKFGIKPDLLIDELEDDTSVDMDLMDNIFINFGVRVWDESEAGRQYLYTFFALVLEYLVETSSADDEIECTHSSDTYVNEDPDDPDDPDEYIKAPACHSITVNTEETNFEFFFSTIRNTFYTMAEVEADSDLSLIYYSDSGTFHSSSGEFLRPAGYRGMNTDDVDNWLDPNKEGVKSHRTIPTGDLGWDNLKPQVTIKNWSGTIYDATGTVLPAGTDMIPEYVYTKYLLGIRIIRPEPIVGVREVTYYAVVPDVGIDAITVYGMGAQVLVQDTEFPDEQRFVKLATNRTNALTVPFMFGIVENVYDDGQMHDKVDALVSSMHVSIYVADITTVETPWWVVLIKVMVFVIAVVLIYFQITSPAGIALIGALTTSEVVLMAVAIYTIIYVISTAIYSITAGNPWLQLGIALVMVAYGLYSGPSVLLMSITDILLNILNIINTVIKTITSFNIEAQKDEFNLIEDTYIEELNDLRMLQAREGIGEYSDVTVEALYGETEIEFVPIDPEAYFEKYDNVNEMGFIFYKYDELYA